MLQGSKRWLAVLAMLCVAASARAQEKKVQFTVGGGVTVPNAEVKDHFGNGYHLNLGLQFNVTPVIGIEGLYSFSGLGDKTLSALVYPSPNGDGVPTDFSADMSLHYGTVSLIAQKPDGGVRPYGLVGMGIYHRPVKLTTPGVGWLPGYCDPWWYVCYPGGWVEVENIIGERSSTDFGMTFGGGVNMGAFYAELRYHYVWGPEVQAKQASQPIAGVDIDGRKANGQFLMTTVGFRF